jgi:hypothetical protein
LRAIVTGVSDPIVVAVGLICIGNLRTIIAGIANTIPIAICLIGIGRVDTVVAVIRNSIAVGIHYRRANTRLTHDHEAQTHKHGY